MHSIRLPIESLSAMCFSSLLISEMLSSDPCLYVFVMLSCKSLLYVSSEVSYMFLVLSAKTNRKSKRQVTSVDNCNCRNKEACPLQNKCMNKDIVYKATISTSNANDTKHYIGMTSSTFKERYRNHIKSFTHKKYSNETELSKHIWHLKQNKTDFTIKWSIIKKSISYTGGSKRCNLCLEEKLNILKEKDNCLLNKRSEIISACQHKNRFQVKSLNKERNACYFNDNTPTFPP